MYTPNCFYCGRNKSKTDVGRYREIALARITRHPGTGKLKKHFNRKPYHLKSEDRRPKTTSSTSSFTILSKPQHKHGSGVQDNKYKTQYESSSKAAFTTSKSKPINLNNYLRCKDYITRSMRLHTQANYGKEEYKRLEKT